jgi:hypothetical protein
MIRDWRSGGDEPGQARFLSTEQETHETHDSTQRGVESWELGGDIDWPRRPAR